MKLFGSTRSPFTHKVLVAAHELSIIEHITFMPVVVSTTRLSEEVAVHNPLGQIPTLVLEDGTAIYDSLVICEYLNTLAGGSLLPAATRLDALNRHALGQGLLDTLVRLFAERRSHRSAPAGHGGSAERQVPARLPGAGKSLPGASGRPFRLGRHRRRWRLGLCGFSARCPGMAQRPSWPRRLLRRSIRAPFDDGRAAGRRVRLDPA